jgi:hypothetical protein
VVSFLGRQIALEDGIGIHDVVVGVVSQVAMEAEVGMVLVLPCNGNAITTTFLVDQLILSHPRE